MDSALFLARGGFSRLKFCSLSQADGAGQAKTFIVCIPDPDREPASIEGGFKIKDAEHFHFHAIA
jgi:hypothetical protein